MFVKLLPIFVLVACSQGRDLIVGNEGGRKVYDQNLEAAPAIWRQERNITVNATNNEVIGQVKVTDLRGEKDGDVKIVEGGEGQTNVTIELKSPTVFRGYDFHVEVYAVTNDGNPSNPRNVAEDSASDIDTEEPRTNLDDLSTTAIPTDSKESTYSKGNIPEVSNQPQANAATTNSPVRNSRDTAETESSSIPSVRQIIVDRGFSITEITKDTMDSEEEKPATVRNDENKDNASDFTYYSDPNVQEDLTTTSPARNSRDVANSSSTTPSTTKQDDKDINVPTAAKDLKYNDKDSQHSHDTSDKSLKAGYSYVPQPITGITKDNSPKSLNRDSRDTESENSNASSDFTTTDLPIAVAKNENATDLKVSDNDSRVTRDTEEQEKSTETNIKGAPNPIPTNPNENSNADNNNRFGNARVNSQIGGSTLKPYFVPLNVGATDLPSSTTEKPTNEGQDQIKGTSQFRRGRQTPGNDNIPLTSTTARPVNPQGKELSQSEGQPMSFKFQPHTLLTIERMKQDTFSKSTDDEKGEN